MSEKNIIYSIPIKVVSSGNALRCTIPKEIEKRMGLKKRDKVLWIYYDNGIVEVKREIQSE